MLNLLFVALGGALGSVSRYLLNDRVRAVFGTSWPTGIFTINVLGGFLMGCLVGVLAHRGGADQERWRVLIGVGVLGGFTTFSSFSLDVALMIERKAYGQAAAYSLASVVVSVIALFAGLMLMRKLLA
ncbi:fluoride efflux transporter CrcB [Phenylobacterium sp.]|jgi:fluoride exporter|uniref:fluoride efflux transporter CrcB n=1 Tax=Phenylobacterium sp. TaxID=1871053 RepID=UPI001200618A|nr:fluoride efflux transporter CrcB [Phenylobacterium sp.]THD66259.1 MAG: fluoride efflux transporter CrcB [Phenylobacterium sp.]